MVLVVRSYLNMLIFNDVALVPVYEESSSDEARALSVIQQAFPERFILPISADALAIDGGTIHCITRTLPIDMRPGT